MHASRSRSVPRGTFALITALASAAVPACGGEAADPARADMLPPGLGERAQPLGSGHLPNDVPIVNRVGSAATFSTAGFIDLSNPFHVPQGTNGRSCESCHLLETGWSVLPVEVELRFWLTQGNDPIFNLLDANSPTADVSTVQARYSSYSMLRKGLFRRGGDVPPTAEYEIVAFDDPLGAGGRFTRFEAFRRPLATANFHIASNVGWHDQNTNGSGDVHAGLVSQAAGNITGAQQGEPPAPETVEAIADYEEGLAFAQQFVFDVGLLTSCGAKGGPENLSAQTPVNARFDLFDAWLDLVPGKCTTVSEDEKRKQIARGQELFNNPNPGGGSCRGCHDAANNGSNVNGRLFDIGASRAEFREPGMPLYTVRNKATLEERQTTDPGRALRSGRWADMDRFKVPSMRGLSARAPYFHNGIAASLEDVVVHYEEALGFVFTPKERDDLVAFMQAL